MRQVILDTETTGLDAKDRVIEIGCIELHNRAPSGRRWHTYLNPERSIHPEATKIHGISDEDLKGKPSFPQIAESFIEFIRGAEVIAHNAEFDLAMLNREFELAGMRERVGMVAGKITDTLKLARHKYPGQRNSLDALCKRLNVVQHNREVHGALIDSLILCDVWMALTREQKKLQLEADPAKEGASKRPDGLRLTVVRATAEELAAQGALFEAHPELKKGPARFLMGESLEGEVIATEP